MKYLVKINIEREVEAEDENEAINAAMEDLVNENGNETLETKIFDAAVATPVEC